MEENVFFLLNQEISLGINGTLGKGYKIQVTINIKLRNLWNDVRCENAQTSQT